MQFRVPAGVLFCCGVTLLLCSSVVGASERRPNIVILLADDLGYGDLQANNPERSRIPTPQMNRLANEGLRFTDGHSSSGCCSPSRYTLLTGRYHWRTSLQSGIVGVWGPPLIAADRLTLPQLTRTCGYRTGCFGKWHLGHDWPITAEQKRWLTGFGGQPGGGGKVLSEITDEHRAAWRAVFEQRIPGGPTERGFDEYFGTDVPNWPPYCFLENDRTIGIPSELLPAALLVKNQASLQGPALPEWSLQKVLPTITERAADFIQDNAKAGTPFFLYVPLTAPHTPLAVNEEWRNRSGLNSEYADFLMETDAAVGRILKALDDSGVASQTLVVLTSDNGCASYIGVKALEAQGHFPSGPFRDYKASAFEGGHRVPFVVRWPGVVSAGGVSHQLVHHADFLATVADLLDVSLPEKAAEDSFSLLPLLTGGDQPIRTHAISTSCSGIPTLREGTWKLILQPDVALKTDMQLYDLSEDPRETTNLAAKLPERVEAMRAKLEELIRRGRSTPGSVQKNDVRVVRYPKKATSGQMPESR